MQQMDVLKQQLAKLHDFIVDLEQELDVLGQYMDVSNQRQLYAYLKRIIKDAIQTVDPKQFAAKMSSITMGVAGILIIAVPSTRSKVMNNLSQTHRGFDPNAFGEMLKGMDQSMKSDPNYPSQPVDATPKSKIKTEDDEPTTGPENDPAELVDLLDLGKHVTKKKQKTGSDPLAGVLDEFRNK